MKNWNFWNYFLLVIFVLAIVYILSPSARFWVCNTWNKIKSPGDKCSNCNTYISGVISDSGECVPQEIVNYENCVKGNMALNDGMDCVGCGSDPKTQSPESFSGKGVIVDGKCMPLPDAFAGKICVPASATVRPSPLSYKRILVNTNDYTYFKNTGNVVSQQEGPLDEQISKDEYVRAYVQTIKSCPVGQVKV